ncbi:5-formyltetrahydrofolate cyclo-ligase [Halobacillus mangrovi]|uniref:5-formyltetrahydrofolate cyclo-ligase n=1 Tax=Halobacillus mangrovi TaxID=402384 RepID=UPI0018DB5639|nr:5-formyltetrahydrofolate cyclo-ligase [Halobacillus mangrovi]
MNKSDLRKQGKIMLKSLTSAEKHEKEAYMYEHLFHSELWKKAQTIGVTVSQAHEWSTFPIIEQGWQEQKIVSVPKCDPDHKELNFYQLSDYSELETVYFGLKEPDPAKTKYLPKQHIDLLIVPGLLFNSKGYRIGYGGGYYDRFLTGFPGATIMIASEEQRHEQLPIEEFDRKVANIITEQGMVST